MFSPFLSSHIASRPTPNVSLHSQGMLGRQEPPPQPVTADIEITASGETASMTAVATPTTLDFARDMTLIGLYLSSFRQDK